MLRTIGLMSGTSLDGVDAAYVTTDGITVSAFGPSITLPYGPDLKAELRGLIDRAPDLPANDPALLATTERMTRVHAEAVAALGVTADLIGFHGQTILHAPAQRRTWQIGDARLLANLTGTEVACDFRSQDVAAGGQGAPLVPYFHQAIAAGLEKPLAVLNLGGVANLTWIGADGTIHACDTGPGNALIDDWARRHLGTDCDHDGALALQGKPDEPLLARWLADEFFTASKPKSIDRQHFARFLDDLRYHTPADGAATLVELTARAVAATKLPARPRRWFAVGGGRHNPALMKALEAALGVPVLAGEAAGWNGDALEAQAFGFLAARVKYGLPLSGPETTGVLYRSSGGSLVSPL